jgi:hypothetical protein
VRNYDNGVTSSGGCSSGLDAARPGAEDATGPSDGGAPHPQVRRVGLCRPVNGRMPVRQGIAVRVSSAVLDRDRYHLPTLPRSPALVRHQGGIPRPHPCHGTQKRRIFGPIRKAAATHCTQTEGPDAPAPRIRGHKPPWADHGSPVTHTPRKTIGSPSCRPMARFETTNLIGEGSQARLWH